MKYLVKLFVVTLFTLVSTVVLAEQKIAYLDMKYILNNSKAGKDAQDYLKKSFEESQKKAIETEKKLKKEESDLLSKKEILDEAEYKKQIDSLRTKVNKFHKERRISIEKIGRQRAEAKQKLLQAINPILIKHVEDNLISLVIDKKYVVTADDTLDITNLIIENLNKSLPSLNLK